MHEVAPRKRLRGQLGGGGGITGKDPWEARATLYIYRMSAENNPNPADPDAELRDRLADAVAAEAVFDGFGRSSLASAGTRLGLKNGEAERLFPGGG